MKYLEMMTPTQLARLYKLVYNKSMLSNKITEMQQVYFYIVSSNNTSGVLVCVLRKHLGILHADAPKTNKIFLERKQAGFPAEAALPASQKLIF